MGYPKLGAGDSRSWSTATWAVPFIVQVVIGATAIVVSLLRKAHYFSTQDRAGFLTAVVITAVVSALTSLPLLRASSPRARGLGLSVAGSTVVVLVGGSIVGFLLHLGGS